MGGESDIEAFLTCRAERKKKKCWIQRCTSSSRLETRTKEFNIHASPMGEKIPEGVMKVIFFQWEEEEEEIFFLCHHEPVSLKGDCVESMYAKTRKMAIFA